MTFDATWQGGCYGPIYWSAQLTQEGQLSIAQRGSMDGSWQLSLEPDTAHALIRDIEQLLAQPSSDGYPYNTAQAHTMTIRVGAAPKRDLDSARAAAIEERILTELESPGPHERADTDRIW